MEAKDRIIVALHVSSVRQALDLVMALSDHVGGFKLGLEFINSTYRDLVTKPIGDAIVVLEDLQNFFRRLEGRLFWDGKLCDIPNTLAGATRPLRDMKVWMLNVHASAGIEAIAEVVKNSGDSLVLAVTVLTSFEENEAHLMFGMPSKAKVLQLARDAVMAEVGGLICSPQELTFLRSRPELRRGRSLLYVTPGIRSAWAATGDQRGITTPADAIKAGADYLVIGRPITKPPKEIGGPVEAAKRIAEEIASVR